MRDSDSSGVELWGGVECTVNRVGDHYFSQLERSGHDSRFDDLDRVAELGVRALRYPVSGSGSRATESSARAGHGQTSGWRGYESLASPRSSD